MSDAKKPTEDTAKTDQELSDLLDSELPSWQPQHPGYITYANSRDLGALDDFSKQEGDGAAASTAATKKEEGDGKGATGADWSDDFVKQAAAQFESNMAVLLGGDGGGQFTPEQLQQSFQKMAGMFVYLSAIVCITCIFCFTNFGGLL